MRVALNGTPYTKPGYHPTLTVLDKSGIPVATFRGNAVAPGRYRVSVVFPRAGSWRYVIADPVTGDWYFVAPHVGR